MTARVTVGCWPAPLDPELVVDEAHFDEVGHLARDRWYIAWLPEDEFSSFSREPTEAEVRAAVEAINGHDALVAELAEAHALIDHLRGQE